MANLIGLVGECAKSQREIVLTNKSSITDRTKHSKQYDLDIYTGFVIVTIPLVTKEDFGSGKNQRKSSLIGVLQFRISEPHYGQFKANPLYKEILNILFETFTIKYLNHLDYKGGNS